MKRKILMCPYCKEETVHMTTEKYSTTRTGSRKRRSVKHCTECNIRTITNNKQNKTYKKTPREGVIEE